MGGNPLGLYQGVHEPLGLSDTGRSVFVSSMPLKGRMRRRQTTEMSGLAERSYGEFKRSGFQPTGKDAPVLLCLNGQSAVRDTGIPRAEVVKSIGATQRMAWVNLIYPMPAEEPAVAGIGCWITTTYVIALSPLP
jgi:hypothetical protein